MSFADWLLIALGVSVDAFAVSAGGALCKNCRPRRICALNAAFFFGGFQFLMPVAGFFTACFALPLVDQWGDVIAAVLLILIGGKMIAEAYFAEPHNSRCPVARGDFFSWKKLFMPAVATSIDAFVVGAGFAFAGQPLWVPAAMMGIVTGLLSALGVYIGSRVRGFGGEKILTVLGGMVIIFIGIMQL